MALVPLSDVYIAVHSNFYSQIKDEISNLFNRKTKRKDEEGDIERIVKFWNVLSDEDEIKRYGQTYYIMHWSHFPWDISLPEVKYTVSMIDKYSLPFIRMIRGKVLEEKYNFMFTTHKKPYIDY